MTPASPWKAGDAVDSDTPIEPIMETLGWATGDKDSWKGILQKFQDRKLTKVGLLFSLSWREALATILPVKKEKTPASYLMALEMRCELHFDRGQASLGGRRVQLPL